MSGSRPLPHFRDIIRRLIGRRTAAEKWNAQYAAGRWTAFERLDELAHYSVLAGYALDLKPGGALLDVGCGDGVLRDRLHPAAFSRYVGLDCAEAIARAQRRADEKTEFVVGDMCDFEPTTPVDTIVFNESLYYASDPLEQLRRYAGLLTADGLFLISTHLKPTTERLWEQIGASFDVIDRTKVTNSRGTTWLCGVARPGPIERIGSNSHLSGFNQGASEERHTQSVSRAGKSAQEAVAFAATHPPGSARLTNERQ